MNFNLYSGELHSNYSINDKNNLFENYIPECYKVRRILISFNCLSEYIKKNIQNSQITGICQLDIFNYQIDTMSNFTRKQRY